MAYSVFTYGTLMFDAVWQRVVRGQHTKSAAILPGYELRAMRSETFPAVIHGKATTQVNGMLYHGINTDELALLDSFEGDYYRRETISVFCGDRPVAAQAYILRNEFRHLLEEHGWNAAEFEHHNLARFINHYL